MEETNIPWKLDTYLRLSQAHFLLNQPKNWTLLECIIYLHDKDFRLRLNTKIVEKQSKFVEVVELLVIVKVT